MIDRLSGQLAPDHASVTRFAADVEYYLSLQPRQLPSRYFYDALGSALFDAICQLPWYGITRAETALLETHARAIFDHLPRLHTIVELGPGSGQKLATLVDAGRQRSGRLDLHLIDISPSALFDSRRTLSPLEHARVVTHQASYEAGLAEAMRERPDSGQALTLFLGSNIGNFDRPGADAFLHGIRAALTGGDALLVGADLVKSDGELILAYDDPLGVTAAFNRNLLVRINRELGGDFDVAAFAHRAIWNASESRVEMHLVSRRRQRVRVDAARFTFVMEEGESIWTESSYKYRPDDLVRTFERTGFVLLDQWINRADGFALTLVRAA